MKTHEFFHKYANMPLAEREKIIKHDRYGSNIEPITLSKIYHEVKAIEDKIRDDVIRREELISQAEDYWFMQDNGTL